MATRPSLVPDDPVLDVTDADVAVTGVYQGRRRMTLTYPILNRARASCGRDWPGQSNRGSRGARGRCDDPAGRIQRANAMMLADQARQDPP